MKIALSMKQVNYESCTLGEFKEKGYPTVSTMDDSSEGYLVVYTGTGNPNTKDYPDYVSWSPKETFDKSYHNFDSLPFGLAIELVKEGYMISRGEELLLSHKEYSDGFFKTVTEETTLHWTPSTEDMLESDWHAFKQDSK